MNAFNVANNENNFLFAFDETKTYLKNIISIIIESPKTIKNKLKNSNNKETYTQTEITKIKNNINNIYQKIDDLCVSLKNNEYFKEEYFDFRDIGDMIKDILNRDINSITKSDLDFILLLLNDFTQLIECKVELIENNEFNVEKFKSIYNDYLTTFNKSKTYYYENIYDESIDDELFIEYSNVLLG